MTQCGRIILDLNCNIIIQEAEFLPDSVYIYILQYNGSKEECSKVIVKKSENQEVKFNIENDGYYTLCTVIIGTNDELNYYYKDDKLYHYWEEIGLQDLLNVKTKISGAKINYTKYFHLCNLENCYLNVSNQILETSKKCQLNQNLTYEKDLLQIAINSIKFLVEKGDFKKAQQILERITGCNGLCTSNKKQNCGCSH